MKTPLYPICLKFIALSKSGFTSKQIDYGSNLTEAEFLSNFIFTSLLEIYLCNMLPAVFFLIYGYVLFLI